MVCSVDHETFFTVYRTCCNHAYTLHLEPREERRRIISRLTFLYKILNEHVAVPMNHLDLVLCDRPVRVYTRTKRYCSFINYALNILSANYMTTNT